jgi:hypothetical protein
MTTLENMKLNIGPNMPMIMEGLKYRNYKKCTETQSAES